jgi:hypothetical protein
MTVSGATQVDQLFLNYHVLLDNPLRVLRQQDCIPVELRPRVWVPHQFKNRHLNSRLESNKALRVVLNFRALAHWQLEFFEHFMPEYDFLSSNQVGV